MGQRDEGQAAMVIGVVFLGVLAGLGVGFVAWVVWRTRRPDWARSDTRQASLEFLITIAPFLGGRVKTPDPTRPPVTAPKTDEGGAVDAEARALAEGDGGARSADRGRPR